MTTPQIDLQKFCAHDGDPREYLHEPWVHKGFAYGCNGRILVRVPCPEQQDAIATGNPLADKAVELIEKAGKASHIPLPVFSPKRCIGCGGDGRLLMVKCKDCDGDGYSDHGRHEYKCKECEGAGLLDADEDTDGAAMHDCPECGGEGFHHVAVPVGDAAYSSVYLQMLKALPNAVICTNGPHTGAHFTFDGGEGLLMPRRAD